MAAKVNIASTGDELLVESYRENSLNRRVVVLADKTITLPLIGVISVDGETVKSLQQKIKRQYEKQNHRIDIQVYRASASQPVK